MKKREAPNPDVLRHQLEVERRSVTELTKEYGYSGVSNLYYWCRKWGINPDGRPSADLRKIPLTPEQDQVVAGSLLGDGYINGHANRADPGYHLVIGHGYKQRAYLEWKKAKLAPFITRDEPDVRTQLPESHSPGAMFYLYRTISHPVFAEYKRLFYPEGKRRLSQEMLDRLGYPGLAIWIMDDGSYSNGAIQLATNAFPLEDVELAADWFRTLTDERVTIAPHRPGQYTLYLRRKAVDNLRPWLRPHFCESLLYKLGR